MPAVTNPRQNLYLSHPPLPASLPRSVSDWLENGSLRDYLLKLFAPGMLLKPEDKAQASADALRPDSERYAKTLGALLEVSACGCAVTTNHTRPCNPCEG